MNTCELCQKKQASVRVTELTGHPGAQTATDKLLCETCAETLAVPSLQVLKASDIWKQLQKAAQKRLEGGPTCPDCGMTLAEFRSRGRFGCPKDYQVFRAHIEPLLLRVHNAQEHKGRLPGEDAATRMLSDLRYRLEQAVRSEAYESAARLRDEIQGLEALQKGS